MSTPPTTGQLLVDAVSALGVTRRRLLAVALTERRDRHVAFGDPVTAEFFNALAVLVADVTDGENRVLRRTENDLNAPPSA
ncbi:hypothetical protein [Streptomyces fructofermentans]|uniref:Uncharacterized protein n=1 Tax=Streptomyces fructofermentans TaxID=152141 RepID=A0A918K848_9ACTN|nr:hypothetical protein [Streptomyces fructofermentans]GGX54167.1 hypothetical protein GCM10010515_21730 [Streptomyces fructofermentans]